MLFYSFLTVGLRTLVSQGGALCLCLYLKSLGIPVVPSPYSTPVNLTKVTDEVQYMASLSSPPPLLDPSRKGPVVNGHTSPPPLDNLVFIDSIQVRGLRIRSGEPQVAGEVERWRRHRACNRKYLASIFRSSTRIIISG